MAAAPTFGVTAAMIAADVAGQQDTSSWADHITRWISQQAARLSVVLRARGYDATTVYGWGSDDDLYQTCQRYVICRVGATLATSAAMGDAMIAQLRTAEADGIEKALRQLPEAQSSRWDGDEMQGSWRSHVDIQRARRTYPARRAGWSRRQKT